MVQLRKKRTALLLYALLLVLPTAVLGSLQGRQIWIDHRNESAGLPDRAHNAAERLMFSVRERLTLLLDEEAKRPFYQYASSYVPEGSNPDRLQLLPSPLLKERRPQGVLAWFSYDIFDESESVHPFIALGHEQGSSSHEEAQRARFATQVDRIVTAARSESLVQKLARMGDTHTLHCELVVVAANRASASEMPCLKYCRPQLGERTVPLESSDFEVQYVWLDSGEPCYFAARRVLQSEPPEGLLPDAPCMRALNEGIGLMQGFLIDPEWLLCDMPRAAAEHVLDPSEELIASADAPKWPVRASFNLVRDLGFVGGPPEEFPQADFSVGIDRADVDARFRAQLLRFVGLAAMLLLSLGIGLVSMLRSVERQLEQVQRTENFVAAVTHELRTPLSTIRLHGEMLRDGWVSSPEQQAEYYERIVRETGRLSTLVERVLEKSRLSSGSQPARPADLNASIERLWPELQRPLAPEAEHGGPARSDLAHELAPELPLVPLSDEALRGMLENLVENARKYAPVDLQRAEAEPILVRTRREGARVLLEVLDRGPGIPPGETERVFEAFYRLGNEATRTAPGAGLGLHLVSLHARSLGGHASVHARPGGGALFRVALPQNAKRAEDPEDELV